jgi:hypothetical protein
MFIIVPDPLIEPTPETATRRRPSSPGTILHVGCKPTAPASVPVVEHPNREPVGFITAGS